jgi:CRP-like cAMP-binding protein
MGVAIQRLPRLFEAGRQAVYQKDDAIIRPGSIPFGVYYIVSGGVKVYSLCLNGEPNIFLTLYAGEIFPIAWAVSGVSRDIGFEALDQTVTRRLSRSDFVQAVAADSALMSETAQALARQFLLLTGEMDNLQYRSAREKVVYRLIFLASHFGQRNGAATAITVRITNDYMARSTNMTRETASRELSRLNRKQLIHLEGGKIVIPDLLRLRNEISRHFNPATLSLD